MSDTKVEITLEELELLLRAAGRMDSFREEFCTSDSDEYSDCRDIYELGERLAKKHGIEW
jgi:hypothetical protein